MDKLFPIIRRKRRPLLAEGHQSTSVPPVIEVPVTESVKRAVEPVEITKPKKNHADAAKN
jgi:hypothetical protein